MTTTTKADRAADTEEMAAPLPKTPRGRHRRPRPRKVLLAVGGLAVAAGVLSLVRLAPESGVGGLGTAEAEPRPDPATGADDGTDRPANAAATISADPTAIPSATSVMGGVTPTPTTTTTSGVVPTPYATATPRPANPTTIPDTTTAATTPPAPQEPAPHQSSTTAPAPAHTPTPAPSRTPNSPAPAPSRPSLCVPIIGLCVDGLANH
ncbi:hypothetical protein OG824_17660 [Streptomyces prunicolor]|nr:hypothetical protein [Streptomyces prunicolor]MCX5237026.1 hypothetical protein [Streptomyces prunicolor]